MQLVFSHTYDGVHSAIFRSSPFILFPRKEKTKSLFSFTYWLRSVKFTKFFADSLIWNACMAHETTNIVGIQMVLYCIVVRWNDIGAAAAM